MTPSYGVVTILLVSCYGTSLLRGHGSLSKPISLLDVDTERLRLNIISRAEAHSSAPHVAEGGRLLVPRCNLILLAAFFRKYIGGTMGSCSCNGRRARVIDHLANTIVPRSMWLC
ncbi:uncharacterized protein LAESUDRAFT_319511 [Laetiporus sulphureus 93-53]|uniref:Uncharacterized protein n=1 Tax=Laetiporus sulphureus 93-53 TaxID=1314785 RepID=A0A165D1B7_9APHY|nr:uncharacterized protein LAESUDRAFT_319511 [Laetiporus sulphureus 93-53]KZT03944.1 hypothetical protein LAESUDRAFT_319511 [Laetiporus sulphureus 93-53]